MSFKLKPIIILCVSVLINGCSNTIGNMDNGVHIKTERISDNEAIVAEEITDLSKQDSEKHVIELDEIKSSFEPEASENPIKLSDDMSYEEYIAYLSYIDNAKPHYKTVFAFENLTGGIATTPRDDVIALYKEILNVFNYKIIHENSHLNYLGKYDYSENFIANYEMYKTMSDETMFPNPINQIYKDSNGNDIMSTPLKTLGININVSDNLSSIITNGRNFQIEDFSMKSKDEHIRVILGSNYKEIYNIGDTLSMEFLSEPMTVEIIAFFETGASVTFGTGASYTIQLDNYVIMPYFIPLYEPTSETEVWEHSFYIGELLSGYIRIDENINEINEDIYNNYVNIIDGLAKKHNLVDMFKIAYWPDGFIF